MACTVLDLLKMYMHHFCTISVETQNSLLKNICITLVYVKNVA